MAAIEILNSVCANILIGTERLQPVVGAVAVSELPAWVVALASCVAFSAGFGVGEVLECFLACVPGVGRLGGEGVFEFRQNSEPAGSPNAGQLMQQAVAFSQAMAARGILITPAQVLPLIIRHQLMMNAARRGGGV